MKYLFSYFIKIFYNKVKNILSKKASLQKNNIDIEQYNEFKDKIISIEFEFKNKAKAYYLTQLAYDYDLTMNQIRQYIFDKYGIINYEPSIFWNEEFSFYLPYYEKINYFLKKYIHEQNYTINSNVSIKDEYKKYLLLKAKKEAETDIQNIVNNLYMS